MWEEAVVHWKGQKEYLLFIYLFAFFLKLGALVSTDG